MVPTIHVGCPNLQTMQSIKPCSLGLPALHDEACEGQILPSLTHILLLSIVKLFDTGFTAVLKAQEVTIKTNGKIVIQGPRDRRNGL